MELYSKFVSALLSSIMETSVDEEVTPTIQNVGTRVRHQEGQVSSIKPHPFYIQMAKNSGIPLDTNYKYPKKTIEKLRVHDPKITTRTSYRCWWHHLPLKPGTPPLAFPITIKPLVLMPSCFCSFECMLAFAHYNRHDLRFRTENVFRFAKMIGIAPTFQMADPWWDLVHYGGHLTEDEFLAKVHFANLSAVAVMPPFVTFPLGTKETWKPVESLGLADPECVMTIKKPPAWFDDDFDVEEAGTWSLTNLKPPSVKETIERLASQPEPIRDVGLYQKYLKKLQTSDEVPESMKERAKFLETLAQPLTVPPKNRSSVEPEVIGRIHDRVPKVSKTKNAVLTVEEAISGTYPMLTESDLK